MCHSSTCGDDPEFQMKLTTPFQMEAVKKEAYKRSATAAVDVFNNNYLHSMNPVKLYLD
jgi:hypothetical protein